MSETAWSGEQIKALREFLALTQDQFAERVGVHVMTVSKWERGICEPASIAIRRTLNALGVHFKRK